MSVETFATAPTNDDRARRALVALTDLLEIMRQLGLMVDGVVAHLHEVGDAQSAAHVHTIGLRVLDGWTLLLDAQSELKKLSRPNSANQPAQRDIGADPITLH
jgi:hypothetical protein